MLIYFEFFFHVLTFAKTKIGKVMKTQNKVQLIGYVGKDPVIKTTPTGRKCISIRVATDSFFKKR